MRENTLNHYCGDHSKCHYPAHQGYQWKNRDMPEAQASFRRYLAEGSKIIQKVDLLGGSTQANDSFHAVKGMYSNKRLNFTTSTEARFALGGISQSRNPDGQDELRESFNISPLPAERSEMLRDLESKHQRKTENMREGPERRKRNESRKESRAKTGRDRKKEDDCASGNGMKPLQTKPKKNNWKCDSRTRYDPIIVRGSLSANMHVRYSHF
jgi:hypothetical protein